MKKAGIVLIALLLVMLSACGQGAGSKEAMNVAAPEDRIEVFGDFSSKDLTGQAVDQTVFSENKLTMVNIWGTFCSPCIKEMPELGQIHAEYAEKGVAVIGIPADITDKNGKVSSVKLEEARSIVEATEANYLHIIPCKEMITAKLSACQSLPETVFVDSHGRQVGDAYSGAKTKEEWTRIIDGLLEAME